MGMVLGVIDSPQPQYTVLAKKPSYEIRSYGSMVLAEVQGKAANKREFDSAHFRVLAQYIGVFGTAHNRRKVGGVGGTDDSEKMDMTAPVISVTKSSRVEQSEPISMTAPVLSAGSKGQDCRLAFILPQQYSLATAPIPLDPRVALREVAARTVAVKRFSGNCPEGHAHQQAEELRGELARDGYSLHPSLQAGEYELARYNPPFTIPMLKTNEVHLVLDESSLRK